MQDVNHFIFVCFSIDGIEDIYKLYACVCVYVCMGVLLLG